MAGSSIVLLKEEATQAQTVERLGADLVDVLAKHLGGVDLRELTHEASEVALQLEAGDRLAIHDRDDPERGGVIILNCHRLQQ